MIYNNKYIETLIKKIRADYPNKIGWTDPSFDGFKMYSRRVRGIFCVSMIEGALADSGICNLMASVHWSHLSNVFDSAVEWYRESDCIKQADAATRLAKYAENNLDVIKAIFGNQNELFYSDSEHFDNECSKMETDTVSLCALLEENVDTTFKLLSHMEQVWPDICREVGIVVSVSPTTLP